MISPHTNKTAAKKCTSVLLNVISYSGCHAVLTPKRPQQLLPSVMQLLPPAMQNQFSSRNNWAADIENRHKFGARWILILVALTAPIAPITPKSLNPFHLQLQSRHVQWKIIQLACCSDCRLPVEMVSHWQNKYFISSFLGLSLFSVYSLCIGRRKEKKKKNWQACFTFNFIS